MNILFQISPQSTILISGSGLDPFSLAFSRISKVLSPLINFPKTTCFPSKC